MSRKHHRSPKNRIPTGQSAREGQAKELAPFQATMVRHITAAVFLAILVTAGYLNILQNGFVWDDTKQILENTSIKPGAPWLPLFTSDVWAFTHPSRPSVNNYYRPLQTLTYKATAQFFGFSAPAFHAVNLILHLLAKLLTYFILYQLTRRVAHALSAAALFALHPIHTEAVAWASALPELGCAVFFLLAYLQFLLATRPPAKESIQSLETLFRRPWMCFLSCVCFALALLWKEMAVTLPLVVASHVILFSPDHLSLRARTQRAFRATLPYWAVLAAYLLLRHYALGFLYVSQRKWALSPSEYFLTVVDLIGKYWWKLLLPVHLNAYHMFYPVRSPLEPRVLVAILFCAAAVAAVAYSYRRVPLAGFAISWVFLTLVPVLDVRAVGRNVFAERYLYIPSVGFCALVVWLAARGIARLPNGWRPWAGIGVLMTVMALFFMQTIERNADWHDPFTFFSRTVQTSPNSPDMQNGLAELLRSQRNDLKGAEGHYRRALSLAQAQSPQSGIKSILPNRGWPPFIANKGNTIKLWMHLAKRGKPTQEIPRSSQLSVPCYYRRGVGKRQSISWMQSFRPILVT